jgi:hypothetical protein
MKLNGKSIGLLLAGLVVLPGCMRVPGYKPVSIKSVGGNCAYRLVQKNLVVQAKLLNTGERYILLGERIQKIYDHEIIYLSIHNLSGVPYVISSHSVDLAQVSSGEIARLIKMTRSAGKLAGSAVTGFYGGSGAAIFIKNAAFGGIGALGYILLPLTVGFSIISLVTGIQGIKSVVMNHRVSSDLADKTLNKAVVIDSGDKYECLLFVKSSYYRSQFSVTLHEKDVMNNVINFDVDLLQASLPIGV